MDYMRTFPGLVAYVRSQCEDNDFNDKTDMEALEVYRQACVLVLRKLPHPDENLVAIILQLDSFLVPFYNPMPTRLSAELMGNKGLLPDQLLRDFPHMLVRPAYGLVSYGQKGVGKTSIYDFLGPPKDGWEIE